jgi:hypothetical protein
VREIGPVFLSWSVARLPLCGNQGLR